LPRSGSDARAECHGGPCSSRGACRAEHGGRRRMHFLVENDRRGRNRAGRRRKEGGHDGGSTTPPPRCAPASPRYHAFLASGSCADVEGKGGRWTSRTAFPDAPAEIRDAACTYQWTSNEAPAPPPDVDALSALGASLLTKSVEAPAVCDAFLAPATWRWLRSPSPGMLVRRAPPQA